MPLNVMDRPGSINYDWASSASHKTLPRSERHSVRVIGFDPGSRITGWAVLEIAESTYRLVASGIFRPREAELYDRVTAIHRDALALIDAHTPIAVAIEDVFYEKNVKSTIKLAYARSGLMIAARLRDVPIVDFSPSVVKKTLVGTGRATKDQVHQMVRVLTGHEAAMTSDESDAVAIAICFAHHGRNGA